MKRKRRVDKKMTKMCHEIVTIRTIFRPRTLAIYRKIRKSREKKCLII